MTLLTYRAFYGWNDLNTTMNRFGFVTKAPPILQMHHTKSGLKSQTIRNRIMRQDRWRGGGWDLWECSVSFSIVCPFKVCRKPAQNLRKLWAGEASLI